MMAAGNSGNGPQGGRCGPQQQEVRLTDEEAMELNLESGRRQGRDALQSIVTALYCKILVILGLALPLAEVISVNVPQGYYQLFYVYLFLGSLLFLFGIHVDIFRTRAKDAYREKTLAKKQSGSVGD